MHGNDLVNYNFCKSGTCTPADNAQAVSTTPLLEWEAASCLPNAYKVRVFAFGYPFPLVKVFEGLAPLGQSPNSLLTALQVNPALDPAAIISGQ